jgi:hypothetical protein
MVLLRTVWSVERFFAFVYLQGISWRGMARRRLLLLLFLIFQLSSLHSMRSLYKFCFADVSQLVNIATAKGRSGHVAEEDGVHLPLVCHYCPFPRRRRLFHLSAIKVGRVDKDILT